MTGTAVAGSAVELSTLTAIEDFDEVGPEWDELVRAMPRPSPFLLHSWLSTWWKVYGSDAELAVHVARRDGELVAALPLFVRRWLGLSVTSFVGGGQSALADMLLAPHADPTAASRLVQRLSDRGAGYLDVYGLPQSSRLHAALGRKLQLVERIEAPVLDLTPSWDEVYAEKTSSKKRNLHRRRRRQLGELGRLETHVARSVDELLPALEESFRLHALRWEGRPDGSGFATVLGRRFHRDAIVALAEQDVPRIVLLTLDGRAIAFHYYFALEGGMYVHRLGFDPSLARYSPGLVNTLDTIEAAAAEGLTRVEYLGGAERYKLELSDRFMPLYQGYGLARGLRAHAVVAARLGSVQLRLRLKRSSALHGLYMNRLAPVRRVAARAHLTSRT